MHNSSLWISDYVALCNDIDGDKLVWNSLLHLSIQLIGTKAKREGITERAIIIFMPFKPGWNIRGTSKSLVLW